MATDRPTPGRAAQNIRRLLARFGIDAAELQRRIKPGSTLVRDILDGTSQNPRADTLQKIASALGVPVAELYGDVSASNGRSAADVIAERLQAARVGSGYHTAESFADEHHVDIQKYRDQENGKRLVTERDARAYAGALNTTWEWLLHGEGEPGAGDYNRTADEPPSRPDSPPTETGMLAIDELQIHVGAGESALGDAAASPDITESHLEVRRTWLMPDDVTRPVTSSPASRMKIVTVIGNSMEPDYHPGERLLVDLDDLRPSPPGTFVVWDGLALVIKQVEFVAWSDPPEVLLKSANPRYETYRRPAGEAYIQGRVIGRWQLR